MRKLFTILFVFVACFAFAQREAGHSEAIRLEFIENHIKSDGELETLYPGNWENAEQAILPVWDDGEGASDGFMFGTNFYEDLAYGQIFENTENIEIHGAVFWIGSREGETGEVIFTVWDYSEGSVGEVLGSKTYSMADITPSLELANAFEVEFDEPVVTSSDFVIGVDFSGLDEWEDETYELGNVSSGFGDGAQSGLALIKESDGEWLPVLNYDVDVDIAVFPFVSKGEVLDDLVYTISLELYPDDIEYKYFLVEDDASWDLGEWVGDPNRSATIDADMTIEDVWGQQPEAKAEGAPEKEEEKYVVTFQVTIAEGDWAGSEGEGVAFDPEVHRVFIAGSLGEGWTWQEPGSHPDLELTIGDDGVIVSAPDIPDNVSVSIFPNPARDRVTLSAPETIREVRIVDLSGRTVLQQSAGGFEVSLNTSALIDGLYIVNIYTENGMTSKKLQVHR